MKKKLTISFVIFVCSVGASLHADVIFQMTTIGNPGNTPDYPYPDPWIPVGSVSYLYQIGTYEVTVSQYTEFLNATAASDPYGLYSSSMGDGGGLSIPIITQSGTDGNYSYTVVSGKENEPVRFVNFYDGIRLANWMSNGQGAGDTETGSYTLEDGIWLTRNANATWVLPSEDEWYKAAYYDPDTGTYYDYPNGSDAVPAEPTDETSTREMNFGDDPYWNPGGLPREYFTQIGQTTGSSPYGVYDLGGNVEEITDTLALPSANRVTRGGGLFEHEDSLRTTHQQPRDPSSEGDGIGFRLAFIIPEPTTFVLLFCGMPLLLGLRRKWP